MIGVLDTYYKDLASLSVKDWGCGRQLMLTRSPPVRPICNSTPGIETLTRLLHF